MGLSFRVRLVGIVAITLFIAYTMLRSGGNSVVVPSMSKDQSLFPQEIPTIVLPDTAAAQSLQIEQTVPTATPASTAAVTLDTIQPQGGRPPFNAASDFGSVADKQVSGQTKTTVDTGVLKALEDAKALADGKSQELANKPKEPMTNLKPETVPHIGDVPALVDNKQEIKPAVAALPALADKIDDKNINPFTGLPVIADGTQDEKKVQALPVLPKVEPVRELTEEEKQQEEKKKEQAAEFRKHELEQAHDHQREANFRLLNDDPAIRAKWNVTTNDIGIILRTGDNIKHKLAGPLSTWASGRTQENMIIFSDRASEFQGWKVHDAIEPWVDRPAIRDTESAKFWRQINGKQRLDEMHKQKRFDAWNMDAMKFVSAVHLGYLQLSAKQNFKWYIFADDDTYWHLPTLADLLSHLNYEDEFYTGGVSYFGIPFAHGGAGAVASAGAMKKRFVDHADTIVEYHDIGATAQYGDTNLARAFEAVDIFFDHSFREFFNSDSPFHRGLDRNLICQHVVTYHHLHVDYFPKLHERIKDVPVLTYAKVMSLASAANAPITDYWHKQDWTYNLDINDIGTAKEAKDMRDNNWAFSVPDRYHDMVTAKSCQEMCRNNDQCIAWTFLDNERTCSMSEWFRLGHERKGSVSGVDEKQFADWTNTCSVWWQKPWEYGAK